jgi:hypothetical protein
MNAASAAEVRPFHAQAFFRSLLQPRRQTLRTMRVLQFAEKLGFVSGYRFSDTASAAKSIAPLGAGWRIPTFSANCLAPEERYCAT